MRVDDVLALSRRSFLPGYESKIFVALRLRYEQPSEALGLDNHGSAALFFNEPIIRMKGPLINEGICV